MTVPRSRAPWRMPPSAIVLVSLGLALASAAMSRQRPSGDADTDRPAGIAASRADLLAMTPLWKGERHPDGRPRVGDDLLRRMKAVKIEEAINRKVWAEGADLLVGNPLLAVEVTNRFTIAIESRRVPGGVIIGDRCIAVLL